MTNTPNEPGQLSPDGQWRWDGGQWVSTQTGQPAPQQPAVPPQQPYQQYAQAAPPQPKKSHTLRNVLLVIVVLMVLAVGGCIALVAGGVNEANKAINDSIAQDKEPGGPDNPMAITVGKAFSVDDFDYAAGWTVGTDALGDVEIKGLKVTNNRGEKDSAIVEIKFMKGSEVLALSDCSTEPIQPGQTVTLSCLSGDPLPKGYDKVTINDAF